MRRSAKPPPRWATAMALVDQKDVVAWVRGHAVLFRPFLLVTGKEVVVVRRGLRSRRIDRVARDKVVSARYDSAMLIDKLTIGVEGGDPPEIVLEIEKKPDGADGRRVVEELDRGLSGGG